MHTVEPDVDRPDPELVAAFEELPSSIVSDVTGNAGVAMDAGIGPVFRGAGTAGTALTVKAVPGDNLVIHRAITMAEPGDVLVVDGDGYTGTAYVGELMCASCEANGLAGVVIDGAVRDREEIAETGFPVYARGVNPQGPFKQAPGSINVTVSCGGVPVDPGDVVVADDDGVSVVPADNAETVLDSAREKMAAEADLRERVENGEYLYDIGGYEEVFENLDVVGPEESVE
ncbi:MAG: 4-carboxy-4-hydroxy-2-oxoadipate aldolase/oxaloacetate decarboxylase [Haloarculaceae archaeon]